MEENEIIVNEDVSNDEIIQIFNNNIYKHILNQHKHNDIPNEDDFQELTSDLFRISDDYKLSYDKVVKYKSNCHIIFKRYLTSSLYISSNQLVTGEVDVNDFLRKIQRKIDIDRTMSELMLYIDDINSLAITERQLSIYFHSLINEISVLQSIPIEFIPYYMMTSARRFFFFINTRDSNKTKINKLVNSDIMEELWFLRRLDKQRYDIDEKIFEEQLLNNWFYYKNSMELYFQFVEHDEDLNGTLNAKELHNYKGTSQGLMHFTIAACQRIIDVHMDKTNCNELDFIGFINLILACENKTTIQSLNYFWKVLNMNDNNILSPDIITYFYNNISYNHKGMPNVDVIIVEVFDLLGCNDSKGPTYEQYIRSGKGYIVASILLDVDCFFIYENRESNVNQVN